MQHYHIAQTSMSWYGGSYTDGCYLAYKTDKPAFDIVLVRVADTHMARPT